MTCPLCIVFLACAFRSLLDVDNDRASLAKNQVKKDSRFVDYDKFLVGKSFSVVLHIRDVFGGALQAHIHGANVALS